MEGEAEMVLERAGGERRKPCSPASSPCSHHHRLLLTARVKEAGLRKRMAVGSLQAREEGERYTASRWRGRVALWEEPAGVGKRRQPRVGEFLKPSPCTLIKDALVVLALLCAAVGSSSWVG